MPHLLPKYRKFHAAGKRRGATKVDDDIGLFSSAGMTILAYIMTIFAKPTCSAQVVVKLPSRSALPGQWADSHAEVFPLGEPTKDVRRSVPGQAFFAWVKSFSELQCSGYLGDAAGILCRYWRVSQPSSPGWPGTGRVDLLREGDHMWKVDLREP